MGVLSRAEGVAFNSHLDGVQIKNRVISYNRLTFFTIKIRYRKTTDTTAFPTKFFRGIVRSQKLMKTTQVPSEPLDPILTLWEDECIVMTKRLSESNPGIEFKLIPYNEFIYVDFLSVPKENRNSGLGTKFMTELVALADEINCPLALTPDISYGATDEARLERFYSRFGFIRNTGRDRDFSTMQTMIRPRKLR